MSPSEFELRDALRHGEDDAHVDAAAIMARGDTVRRERRVRYLTTAAAAIVVAGVTTGIVLNNGDSSNTGSTGALRANAPNDLGGGQAARNGDSYLGSEAVIPPKATGPGCTDIPPALGVPTGPARTASFFTQSVSAFTVCAYRTDVTREVLRDDSGQQLSTMLTGSDAADVAQSLNSAPTVQHVVPCPIQPGQIVLTLRPYYSDGSAGPIILASVQPPCALPTTNGTVVRYAWRPPPVLDAFLAGVRAQALKAVVTQPSGKGFPTPTNS